jgi:hypothetical protein
MIVWVGTCTLPETSTDTIFGAVAAGAAAGEISIKMEASTSTKPAHRWSAPRARQRVEVIKKSFLESSIALTLVASEV